MIKLTLIRCKTFFLNNPPKTEDEKYAYDIIRKAYWINEKKIEMLDFDKNKKLLEDFIDGLTADENDNERRCNNEIVQQNNSYCVNRFDFNTIIVVLFKRGNQQFFK